MSQNRQFRITGTGPDNKTGRIPVLFVFRYVVMAAFLIGLIVMVPMVMVWKQVYITALSRRFDELRDSTAVLQKEIAVLNMSIEQLSRTERLEKIARESLGLEYPSSKQIIVVRSNDKRPGKNSFLDSHLWMVVRKSLSPKKG